MTRSLYLTFSQTAPSSSTILLLCCNSPSIFLWYSSCLFFRPSNSSRDQEYSLALMPALAEMDVFSLTRLATGGGRGCCCFFLSSGKQSPFMARHFFYTSKRQACCRLQLTSLVRYRFWSYFNLFRIYSASLRKLLTPPTKSSLISFSMTLSCTFVTFFSPSTLLTYQLICASTDEILFSNLLSLTSLPYFSSLPVSAAMVRLYIQICLYPFYNSRRMPAELATRSFSSSSQSPVVPFFLGTNFLCLSCSVSSSEIFLSCFRSSQFFWLSFLRICSRSASYFLLRLSEQMEAESSVGEWRLPQSMEWQRSEGLWLGPGEAQRL